MRGPGETPHVDLPTGLSYREKRTNPQQGLFILATSCYDAPCCAGAARAGAAPAGKDDLAGLRTAGPATHHAWRDPTKDSEDHARQRFTHAINLPGTQLLCALWEREWERRSGRAWRAADGKLLTDGGTPGPHTIELDTIHIRAKPGTDKQLFTMRPATPDVVPPELAAGALLTLEGATYTVTSTPTRPSGARAGTFTIDPPYEGTGAPRGKVVGSVSGGELDTVHFMPSTKKDTVRYTTRTFPDELPTLLRHGASVLIEGGLYLVTDAPKPPAGQNPGSFSIAPEYHGRPCEEPSTPCSPCMALICTVHLRSLCRTMCTPGGG